MGELLIDIGLCYANDNSADEARVDGLKAGIVNTRFSRTIRQFGAFGATLDLSGVPTGGYILAINRGENGLRFSPTKPAAAHTILEPGEVMLFRSPALSAPPYVEAASGLALLEYWLF